MEKGYNDFIAAVCIKIPFTVIIVFLGMSTGVIFPLFPF